MKMIFLSVLFISVFPIHLYSQVSNQLPTENNKKMEDKAPLPQVQLTDLNSEKLPYQFKIGTTFETNEETAKVFYFKIAIKLQKDIQTITPESSKLINFKGPVFRLLLPNLTDTIEIKYVDQTTEKIKISLFFKYITFYQENCQSKNFNIKMPNNIPDNFYVAASCSEINGAVNSSVSIPQELSWGPSTVFETAGKGERWKLFVFNQVNLTNKTGEIGRINVMKDGKITPCVITFLPGSGGGEKEKPPEKKEVQYKPYLFYLPIGISQVSIKTTDTNSSNLGYLISGAGKFIPEKSRYMIQAQYMNSLSSSQDGQVFSLFQIGGGYLFGKPFGAGTFFSPIIAFTSFSSQAPKVKLNILHNQFSFGFNINNYKNKIKKGWDLNLSFSGFVPKSDSQVMQFDFIYLFSAKIIGKGIGFSYLNESLEYKKTATSEKTKTESNQILLYGILHF